MVGCMYPARNLSAERWLRSLLSSVALLRSLWAINAFVKRHKQSTCEVPSNLQKLAATEYSQNAPKKPKCEADIVRFRLGLKSIGWLNLIANRRFRTMKVTTSIQRGAEYLYTKLGAVVTAVQQVAVVKGRAVWEVERVVADGPRKRLIVSARSLMPIPTPVAS